MIGLFLAALVAVAPTQFLSIVGDWTTPKDGPKTVLQVDGRQWIKGQPSAGLAAKARTIYGARHEEFIDSVKAYAYFPYAVAKDGALLVSDDGGHRIWRVAHASNR